MYKSFTVPSLATDEAGYACLVLHVWVCVLCINVLPFTDATLISHPVKESTSTVIHQRATQGGMATWEGKTRIKKVKGRGRDRWMDEPTERRGKERSRLRRNHDGW